MKLAILHYHLNRGGVTQVIANQVQALQLTGEALNLAEILILHGGRADGWPNEPPAGSVPVHLASVDALDYDTEVALRESELADTISGRLHEFGFSPGETILHIHNHSLGKNASLPGAIRRLGNRGCRIVLQIHDFAEDLRPANYAIYRSAFGLEDAASIGQRLYPAAPHIHYALLNSRDHDLMSVAGVFHEQLHCLPNPVAAVESHPSHEESLRRFRKIHGLHDSQRVILYPVRGIRRKNLGELLLWAAATPDDTVFALTLPATSPAEVPAFRRFRQLAEELKLPVLFDVGLEQRISFEENMAAASHIITTSAAEGFGLVFLESWLHGRPLIGRNLPEITANFAERGVDLSHLADTLDIPIDWLDVDRFFQESLQLQAEVAAGYGQTLPDTAEETLRIRLLSGTVDFAALSTREQFSILRRLAGDKESARALLDINPWMVESLDEQRHQGRIASNAAAVRTGFSLERSAVDLVSVYQQLLGCPTDEPVESLPSPEQILYSFLDIRRLCPVRVEP